jgi:aminoglycoside phosphotransferase (APT) family kinase protein
MSSAVHAVTVDDGLGNLHRAVLRRYVRPDVQAEEPDLAAREATALRVAAAGTVPTPHLIAVDPTGDEAGVPALLMSLVPGRIEWAPADVEKFLWRLAEPLVAISEVTVPDGLHLPPYKPYELGRALGPPPWTRLPTRVWDAAVELYEGPAPLDERLFIHRDYHPGNVLWRRGVLTGVVDWPAASLGSPEADVAHCRSNLHDHFGKAVADRFLTIWQKLSGRQDFHPYWDIAVVLAPPSSYGRPDPRLDEFVGSAIARL